MDLEFTVNNQTLKRKDSNQVVTSSSEYLQLVFDFETDDWTGLSKYAFFRTGHINYPFELTDDSIIVPAYFLNDKYLLFGLYGMGDGDIRITTNVLRLHLENSYYDSETVDVRNFLDVIVDELETEIGTKANNDDVLAWLALKADTSYVDEQLQLKSDKTYVDNKLATKVDKITGKQLSTNDFTNYYKNFLDGFDGNIEAFLEEHKEEIEELLIGEALKSKADKVHTHTKSDITNFSHTHTKNEITDFAHNHDDRYYTENEVNTKLNGKSNTGHKHTESDITDLQDYALSDEVYSKTEVDNLIYDLNNKMNVNSDKNIIQSEETSNITVQVKEKGFPAINKTVNIYKMEE